MTIGVDGSLVGKPLREILESHVGLSAQDWERATERDPAAPERALVESGLLSPAALAQAKAARWGLPFVDLDGSPPAKDALDAVSTQLLNTGLILPLRVSDDALTVAIADPDQWQLRDALEREAAPRQLELVVAPAPDIQARVVTVDDEAVARGEGEISEDDTRQLMEAPPVVRLVDHIINEGISQGASDIHVGNWGHGWETRYRVDGRLQRATPIPKRYFPGVISRLKVLAKLDIAEHRLPQDGEIPWPSPHERRWDLRIVTMPAKRSEHAAIRIFGRMSGTSLGALGYSGELLATLDRLCSTPSGLILATGPTGCGKTTTLATMLRRIQTLRPESSVYSVEDPIEMSIPGAVQIQVLPKAGLTFATVLRSLLRADPDIILVGEIRDAETARIAVQAALTGHLVLATLHTNDAPSAVTRLIDIGIEPYLVADVLRGVIAQRLVRRTCDRCRTLVSLSPSGGYIGPGLVASQQWRGRGTGCHACYTGYRGRLAVAELLALTPAVASLVASGASTQQLRDAAGMRSIIDDGYDKILAGLTTVEEVRFLTCAADPGDPAVAPEASVQPSV